MAKSEVVEFRPVKTKGNPFKVPLSQWRKWTPEARAVFNEVNGRMRDNQKLVTHPDAKAMPPAQWETIAWNAAWLAADAATAASVGMGRAAA
jgi:hypothetical protein